MPFREQKTRKPLNVENPSSRDNIRKTDKNIPAIAGRLNIQTACRLIRKTNSRTPSVGITHSRTGNPQTAAAWQKSEALLCKITKET